MIVSTLANRGWLWQRLLRGHQKVRQHPEWATFAGPDWLDRIMDVQLSDRFHAKQGRSIARWTLTAASGQQCVVYLKRHYVLPRRLGLLAVLFPGHSWSAGLQEYEHLQWAAQLGLPVPRTLAAGELVDPGARLRSFLAVEELTGMLPLHEAIPLAQQRLSPVQFQRWKSMLVAEMARLAAILHQRSVFHKDLYLCHYYIAAEDCETVPESWPGRVYLIDLHRLARHPITRWWWQVKDLAELLYSSEIAGVTVRDRLRFWRAYRKQMGRGTSWLGRFVRQKWRLYRKHNQKRQANRTKSLGSA